MHQVINCYFGPRTARGFANILVLPDGGKEGKKLFFLFSKTSLLSRVLPSKWVDREGVSSIRQIRRRKRGKGTTTTKRKRRRKRRRRRRTFVRHFLVEKVVLVPPFLLGVCTGSVAANTGFEIMTSHAFLHRQTFPIIPDFHFLQQPVMIIIINSNSTLLTLS